MPFASLLEDPFLLLLIFGVFTLAGFVKGVVGFGLPLVSLAIMTVILGLREAMALMLVPAFATNLLQAFQGGAFLEILRRLWSFLLPAVVLTWLTLFFAADLATGGLVVLLGLLLLLYGLYGLLGPKLPAPGPREAILSPGVGALSGVLSGLTGVYVMPAGIYFELLKMGRDRLVQAMGVWFVLATLSIGGGLQSAGLIEQRYLLLSCFALLPAALGMWLGQRLRKRLSEETFRRVFLSGLVLVGSYLVLRRWVLGL